MSDMNQNNPRYEGEEMADLFEERRQLDQSARQKLELEHARREAAMKANRYAPSMVSGTGIDESAPRIEDYSDSQKYSMNRLNPEVQLTSVEEEYRRGQQLRAKQAEERARREAMEKAERERAMRELARQEIEREGVYYQSQMPQAPAYAQPQMNMDPVARAAMEGAQSGYMRAQEELGMNVGQTQAVPLQPQMQMQPQMQPQMAPQAPVDPMMQTISVKTAPSDNAYDYDYDSGESGYIFGQNNAPAPQTADTGRNGMTPEEKKQAAMVAAKRKKALEEKERAQKEQKEKQNKIVIFAVLGVVAILLIAVVLILLLPSGDKKDKDSSLPEQVVDTSDMQSFVGVITHIDKTNETFLVYNADTRKEESFSLVGADKSVSLSAFRVGQIIDITYDAANDDVISEIKLYDKTTRVDEVTGTSVAGGQISVNKKLYTLDDYVIVLYNGEQVDPSEINNSTVFSAVMVGEHIYVIEILSGSGKLVIENMKDYNGGNLTITAASGDPIESRISLDQMDFTLPEGSVSLTIVLDQKEVYTGKLFITADEEVTVKLPDVEEEAGTIVFTSNARNSVITIDGKDYGINTAITFEYGDYTGTCKADGYMDAEVRFTVDKVYRNVKIEMTDAYAEITVSANVSDFSVYVDGTFKGKASGSSITIKVEEGSHRLQLIKEGYNDQSQNFTVGSDLARQSITLSGFEALPTTADITIVANVPGYKVVIDGQTTENASDTYITLKLEKGEHNLVFSKEGYQDTTMTVTVNQALDDQTLSMTLTKLPEESSEESSETGGEGGEGGETGGENTEEGGE